MENKEMPGAARENKETADALYARTVLEVQGAYIDAILPRKRPWNEPARRFTAKSLATTVGDIAKFIRPSVSVEIGAFEASFSKGMKAALPDTRVIAFEANPMVYESKRRAITAAGVEYLNVCIGSETGKRQFHMPLDGERECQTMGSVLFDTARHEFKSFEVDGISLDAFLGDASAEPNVLWVDVEGAVDQVLAGCTKALSSCMLFFVELETRERWAGQYLDTHTITTLSRHGLRPVLRDKQSHHQYNGLFLREDVLANPAVQQMMQRYVKRMCKELKRLRNDEILATSELVGASALE